jgi:hypothetical protein
MDDFMRLIVYRGKIIFDDVIVQPQNTMCYEKVDKDDDDDQRMETSTGNTVRRKDASRPISLCWKGLDSYLVSAYIAMLSQSYVYRRSAMNVLREFCWMHDDLLDISRGQVILVRLRTPKKQFLDYKW